MRKTYSVLTKKYRGGRIKTYTRFFELFGFDAEKIWKKKGFLHCTNLNKLMRLLLARSGWFKEGDIRKKWTLIWYLSPHQYLRIRVGRDALVNIDLWGKPYGIQYGDYARGFH